MGAIFSSGPPNKPMKKPPGGTINSVDRALLDLKNARDRLQKYKKKLDLDEQKLLGRAKAAKEAGQSPTALGLLRLRRHKLRQVEDVEGQLLTVLQMVETIDSKQNEKEVLQAMKTGKNALQKMHEETTVDDVLELIDQIQEQSEVEKEISGILSDVPSLSSSDEEEVEAELEALATTVANEETGTLDSLPVAPTKPLVVTEPSAEAAKTSKPERKVAVAS